LSKSRSKGATRGGRGGLAFDPSSSLTSNPTAPASSSSPVALWRAAGSRDAAVSGCILGFGGEPPPSAAGSSIGNWGGAGERLEKSKNLDNVIVEAKRRRRKKLDPGSWISFSERESAEVALFSLDLIWERTFLLFFFRVLDKAKKKRSCEFRQGKRGLKERKMKRPSRCPTAPPANNSTQRREKKRRWPVTSRRAIAVKSPSTLAPFARGQGEGGMSGGDEKQKEEEKSDDDAADGDGNDRPLLSFTRNSTSRPSKRKFASSGIRTHALADTKNRVRGRGKGSSERNTGCALHGFSFCSAVPESCALDQLGHRCCCDHF
jgi:hypothetical protein